MSQVKAKVLMIGNELSLGESIKKALVDDGYEVFHILHPDESTAVLNSHRIDVMLVDCMLPRINGVDFVEQLQHSAPNLKVKVILMSGIYTDKSFIQDATKRTKAVAFIKKEMPFEVSQILEILNKFSFSRTAAKSEMPARKQLYQIFSKEKMTNRERRRLIESLEEVSGFDLPFIYSLLVEAKSSGYLNIYEKNGSVSGISFSSGMIVGVDVEDKGTYLGELLIQGGFATPLDVQNAVKDKTNMRLGQKLIKGNLLSPHAFDLALSEQMNIRLSRTIVDQVIRVNFASSEVEMSAPCIDSDQLLFYLHDWIVSKLDLAWLRSLYMMWAGHNIEKTPSYRLDHPALQMSLIKQVDGLLAEIEHGTSINKLLTHPGVNEAALYKALHFMLNKGLIVFSNKTTFSTPGEQLASVRKMAENFKGKTPYEIIHMLNISPGDEDNEELLMQVFLKAVGPEPSTEVADLHGEWSALVKQFQEVIKKANDTSFMDQMKELNQTKEAEKKLRATQLVDEGRQFLINNIFGKAFEKISEALKLHPQVPNSRVFMAWAKLGQLDPAKRAVGLKDIEFDLMQVPAEEKYEIFYPYVMGLFHKAKGDFNLAKKSFDKALALDSAFLPARRELNSLAAHLRQKERLGVDLKEMVSGFFRKR